MRQANLNLAYEDFLRQEGYPKEQVKFLADILSGIRLPQTTVTQTTEMPAMPGDPSAIVKAIGGAKGIDTLLNMFNKYFPSDSGESGDFDYDALSDWLDKQMSGSGGPQTGGGKPAPIDQGTTTVVGTPVSTGG
jgi:hypothetical protein